MSKTGIHHVLLDIPEGHGFLDRFCVGVVEFAKEAANWRIYSGRYGLGRHTHLNPASLSGRLCTESLSDAKAYREKHGIPVVTFASFREWQRQACVHSDHLETVDLAIQHFRELGLENMAFCGANNKMSASIRADLWAEQMKKEGRKTTCFHSTPITHQYDKRWQHSQKKLQHWLLTLPKPCGILACSDGRAAEIVLACEQLDLLIPKDIALLGINNDRLICLGNQPSLSSIDTDARRIGFEAAGLLHEYMSGERRTPVELAVSPGGVIQRESTSILYLTDPMIEEVVKQIRTQGKRQRLRVSMLHESSPVSRRSFTSRFEKAMGCTPKQEIDRVSGAEAIHLLKDTRLSIQEIAFQLGFESPQTFSRFMQHQFQMSPTKVRNQP